MLAQNRLIEQIEHLKKQFVQMDLPGISNLVNTERLAVMIEEAMEKEVPHNLQERIWTPVVTLFAVIKQKLVNGGGKDAVTFVQAELSRAGKEPCSDNRSYIQARQNAQQFFLLRSFLRSFYYCSVTVQL